MKRFASGLKIKQIIIMTITCILVIMCIMGGFAIRFSIQLSQQTQTLYNQPHTNLVAMWTAKAQIAEAGSLIKDAVLNNDASESSAISSKMEAVLVNLQQIHENRIDKSSNKMMPIIEKTKEWQANGTAILNAISQGAEISPSDLKNCMANEKEAIKSIDTVIVTASDNAVKFKNNAKAVATRCVIILSLFLGFAVIIALILLSIILASISKPIEIIIKAAQDMAEGNLHSEITYHSTNEYGNLADSFRQMKNYLANVVSDIDTVLEEISKGNFTVTSQFEYIGDFKPIAGSLTHIQTNLSKTIQNINQMAEQVSSSSGQVSVAAQALSQGSAEQAGSIEQLSASLNSIATKVTDNAGNAEKANEIANIAGTEVANGNKQMEAMITAMEEIAENSKQIGNIMKTIDDISFQTNILALNAAVEAARAGTAGKGFAVVADEVRNLAGKCAEAVQNTGALIDQASRAVENGNSIAASTALSLEKIVETTNHMTLLINQIAAASSEQAEALVEVSTGIDQITSVTQTNSATAEECAASSEELSSQAKTTRELVQSFKLLNSN